MVMVDINVLLSNISKLAASPSFQTLWLQVLRRLAADLSPPGSSGHNEVFFETSNQLLHNMLMVMDAEGIFKSVSERSSQDLLELTFAVLDAICPQVRESIGPIGVANATNPESDAVVESKEVPPISTASVPGMPPTEACAEGTDENDVIV